MKNQYLLISCTLFLFSPLAMGNEDPESLFSLAKESYNKSDCKNSLHYFDEYLKVGTPSEEKRASIEAAIEWCSKKLKQATIISKMDGMKAIKGKPVNIQRIVGENAPQTNEQKPQ